MTRQFLAFAAPAALLLAACQPPAAKDAPAAPEAPAAPSPPAAPDAPAAPAAPEIPAQFRGEWNTDLARCGTDLGEMRLLVTGRSVGLYESGGPVLDVILEDEATALLRTRLTGEGETWERPFRLRLADGGRTLTDISGETPVVRYRCPGGP